MMLIRSGCVESGKVLITNWRRAGIELDQTLTQGHSVTKWQSPGVKSQSRDITLVLFPIGEAASTVSLE